MPKKKTPDELENVWCPEIKEAWDQLKPKQQIFFLAWINNNFNATQAYWDTYNKQATANTAAVCGHNYLRNPNIQTICSYLTNDNASDLVLIKKTYKAAMDANKPVFKDGEMIMEIEDHQVRASAAEKLAKLNGELIDKVQHSGGLRILKLNEDEQNL